ncbi:MAG: OST-HTH/LOTUS domain-containing protein, partial [Gammaproteobacteria bacterium]
QRSRRRGGKAEKPTPAAAKAAPVNETAPAPAAEDAAARPAGEEERRQEGLDVVMATVADLFDERGQEDKVWASMVKQTLKRLKPGFNERYHGFRTFAAMLEELQSRGLLELEHDEKSGSYIIRAVHG